MSVTSLAQQFARDDQLADFSGARANLKQARVAPDALYVEVRGVTPPSKDLHRLVRGVPAGSPNKENGRGGLLADALALLGELKTLLHQQARSFQVRVHIGELGLNELEF